MSAVSVLREALRSARVRRFADTLLCWLPWLAIAVALAWRLSGPAVAAALLVAGTAAIAMFAGYRARVIDTGWLARQLNNQRRDMEDSAELFFANAASMTALERLQLGRLGRRIDATTPPDLRPPWSKRGWLLGGVALLLFASILLWPARQVAPFADVLSIAGNGRAAPTHTRLTQQQLQVTPPGYTRLPARTEATLDTKAPQGTRLQWRLRFDPQPATAEIVFHDGRRIPLARRGDDWSASHVLDKPALYRVVPDTALPLQPQRLHRLDVVPDRPPQLRVLAPDRSLSLLTPGQRNWALAFEASDDYGVAATAHLRITLAQGSGESITFREQTMTLPGKGRATSKRYAQRLDLGALGLAAGDDLIVQFSVNDNHSPKPQLARSPSLILRWPSDLGNESTGLEGMVKKTLPAYFRSQRQIIIDAEALLAQRRKLDGERYLKRSDEIGVDQRILRLRYGQFLGEESEGGPKRLPTNDAEPEVANTEAGGHAGEDGPGHAPVNARPGFGREEAVLEEYGHTHDHAEAATLLDPETRATLKAALDQMWQSELNLRQGHPELALRYANRALRFIKQVQQASRIYLARVGPELPPIDENRRLGGDRAGLSRRNDALEAATASDPVLATLWRALDEAPSPDRSPSPPVDFNALERWLREHESRLPDPLAVIAAIEALRSEPACTPCRRNLRALLWPLLTRPPASVQRRDEADASGRRYLDALRQEGGR